MNQLNQCSRDELTALITAHTKTKLPDLTAWPYPQARAARDEVYGRRVYLRGLLEITSYCKQNCLYCGLRRENERAKRYRSTPDEILACCRQGHAIGFRTFVLQGGEDAALDDKILCRLVERIKAEFPDTALTLSLGERSPGSYKALREAGADRYLLRHESANPDHYSRLHPAKQGWESRRKSLFTLKELGYQVGAGFMVGSPHQKAEHLADDLLFLQELQPHMVGIGPFLPHHATPFAANPRGSLGQTLLMLALVRLLLPAALLPATTALASLHPQGRILGLESGANVVMPNLSPPALREQYNIYDGKLSTGAEAAQGLTQLKQELEQHGYAPALARGDAKSVDT